jgi:hypothetical protein
MLLPLALALFSPSPGNNRLALHVTITKATRSWYNHGAVLFT